VADLGRALTPTEIGLLPGLGVSRIIVTNGALTLSAAQHNALASTNLTLVTAPGSYLYSDGASTLYQSGVTGQSYGSDEKVYDAQGGLAATAYDNLDATGLLSLGENGLTTTVGNGLLTVQTGAATGGDVFPLAAHASETINAAGTTGDTFVFAPGAGQTVLHDTLNGFDPSSDVLQFSGATFTSASSPTPAQELAALLNSVTNAAGAAVITDLHGDTLTLANITKASLTAHNVAFK